MAFLGDLIASAGDGEVYIPTSFVSFLTRFLPLDGMIIVWAPSATPQSTTYGSDLTPDEVQFEKEYWKPRTTFRCAGFSAISSLVLRAVRCTTMQVYDLAWSPTGEYIIAGSTDNTARVFASADGVYAST